MHYNHREIEKKWQEFWEEKNLFKAIDTDDGREKMYILDMFPYPSGAGLHVGHPEGYTATDIISRFKRMNGVNVLHPMGWDAFGLPAENYAIKTNIHPDKSTHDNIKTFTAQIKSLGFSYDWEREIATCDADYYKWTQWFFLFLYNQGLAYKKEAPVNWCNDCMTVLANEQVINGKCDRCKNEVVQKNLSQWFFKITDFIEDNGNTSGLINGLDKIDWPESTKISQRNWIGKSTGCDVSWKVDGHDLMLDTYTTTVDTIYGVTFAVISPEHPKLLNITTEDQKKNIKNYIEESKKKTELERMSEGREKTGAFTGAYLIHPLNNKKIPLYVADYVLMSYGTGVVMGVPAHDQRDLDFANKYEIEIIQAVQLESGETFVYDDVDKYNVKGQIIDSKDFTGMNIINGRKAITEKLEEIKMGKATTQYKLRDWLVSRQRYWGAPIPIVYDPDGKAHPVKEEHLPILLPTDVDYKPKGTSPLGSSEDYVKRAEELYGKGWRFEIDTMDTFVCSSWYYWRFLDPKNDQQLASKELMKAWGNVDLYVGGAEHTVLHLLYARFFCKAMHKAGYIDYDEPFQKLRHQGMILGEDNEKMSKSRGNVVNPDEIVEQYGADTLRLYEMFMGPFKDAKPWNMKGVEGCYKFLNRVWRACHSELSQDLQSKTLEKIRHQSIKKVSNDIENFAFNTAVSQMMIYVNEMQKLINEDEPLAKVDIETLVLLLSPFAPHMAEELWQNLLGNQESISLAKWPEYDEELCKEDEIEFVIQINGKVRAKMTASPDITKDEAITQAKALPNIQKYLSEGEIRKEIFVPAKLVNIVVI